MIRVTVDLHAVSKGSDGAFWVSSLTMQAWNDYKQQYTWCQNDDAILRAELRERFGEIFIRVPAHIPLHEAITERLGIGVYGKVESVRAWPQQLNLEEEFDA